MRKSARSGWALLIALLAIALLLAGAGFLFFGRAASVAPAAASSSPAAPKATSVPTSGREEATAAPTRDSELVAPPDDGAEEPPPPDSAPKDDADAALSGRTDDVGRPAASTPSAPGAYAGPGDGLQSEAMPSQSGTIRGRVFLDGAAPEAAFHTVRTDDAPNCSELEAVDGDVGRIADLSLQVDANGGIANAVVSIVGLEGSSMPPPTSVTLDHGTCRFEPRMLVVNPGTRVSFTNSDSSPFELLVRTNRNTPLTTELQPGANIDQIYDRADRVEVACSGHDWQKAWVVVAESPYVASTADDGRFELRGVPAGMHRVQIWHPTLGEIEQELDVAPGQTLDWEIPLRR